MPIEEIIEFIQSFSEVRVIGTTTQYIGYIHTLESTVGGGLTFCMKHGEEATHLLQSSGAKAIICNDDVDPKEIPDKTLIQVSNPRLSFIRVAKHFFPPAKTPDIHPSAIINNPYVDIGKNVKIGPGCTIGFDGFGYEKNKDGKYKKFPHYGKVIIGDNVEIGANVNIDRGTLSDTVIGAGTKIDSLTHIAHNVEIGKNCIIVCLTCIAGGVKIRDGAWVAPLVGVREELEVGENAVVGMGAIVIRDVPPNDVVAGVPAKSLRRKHDDG